MTVLEEPPAPPAEDRPRQIVTTVTRGDQVYRRLARVFGGTALALMGAIALFLVINSWEALQVGGLDVVTTEEWQPDAEPPNFGFAALMVGTFIIGITAVVVALPLSIALALFINEIAPRSLRRPFTSLIDLLAAVPSLIFGMWGRFYLSDQLYGVSRFLADHLDFIPIFRADQRVFAASMFVAGLVVALMVLPICTSVIREVFSQAPPGEKEAALALGGTRWGMIRTVVLPFGRGGIIGGTMLGLGRALGETIAITLILSGSFQIWWQILDPGGATVASTIALRFPEAKPFELKALMAAGLALFVVTLLINMLASFVVSRSRSGAGVEI